MVAGSISRHFARLAGEAQAVGQKHSSAFAAAVGRKQTKEPFCAERLCASARLYVH